MKYLFALLTFFIAGSAMANSESNASHSAKIFTDRMYANVLGDNFSLQSFSYPIGPVAFNFFNDELDLSSLRNSIGLFVKNICLTKNNATDDCNNAQEQINTLPITKMQGNTAAHAFGEWIFSVDGDNWYQYNPLMQEVNNYIIRPNVHLLMFENFSPYYSLASLLSTNGLPIVIDTAENTLTVWTLELRD